MGRVERIVRAFVDGKDFNSVTARQVKDHVRKVLGGPLKDSAEWKAAAAEVMVALDELVNEAAATQSQESNPVDGSPGDPEEPVDEPQADSTADGVAGPKTAIVLSSDGEQDDGENEDPATSERRGLVAPSSENDSDFEALAAVTTRPAQPAKGDGTSAKRGRSGGRSSRSKVNETPEDGSDDEADEPSTKGSKRPRKGNPKPAPKARAESRSKQDGSPLLAPAERASDSQLKRLMQRTRELGLSVPIVRFRGLTLPSEKFKVLIDFLESKGASEPLKMTPQEVGRFKKRIEKDRDLEGLDVDNIIDEPRARRALRTRPPARAASKTASRPAAADQPDSLDEPDDADEPDGAEDSGDEEAAEEDSDFQASDSDDGD